MLRPVVEADARGAGSTALFTLERQGGPQHTYLTLIDWSDLAINRAAGSLLASDVLALADAVSAAAAGAGNLDRVSMMAGEVDQQCAGP